MRYDKLEEGDKPKTRTKLREVGENVNGMS